MDFLFPFGIKEFQEKIRTYTYKEKTHENLIIITIDPILFFFFFFPSIMMLISLELRSLGHSSWKESWKENGTLPLRRKQVKFFMDK